MRFLIQRVKHASVQVDGLITGEIQTGYLIFIGISHTDTEIVADKLIKKTAGLRIFGDENGKTNLSICDVKGALLLVSQFTLYADCKKGNRPSFVNAGNPLLAEQLYQYIIHQFETTYQLPVKTGVFGADMNVELNNDGPFTIVLDSEELTK